MMHKERSVDAWLCVVCALQCMVFVLLQYVPEAVRAGCKRNKAQDYAPQEEQQAGQQPSRACTLCLAKPANAATLSFRPALITVGLLLVCVAFPALVARAVDHSALGDDLPTVVDGRLNVMTYNIFNGYALSSSRNLDRVADVIRDAKPHVVGLQGECMRCPGKEGRVHAHFGSLFTILQSRMPCIWHRPT